MDAQKRPLAVKNRKNVEFGMENVNQNRRNNDPTYLKRFRESPPNNLLQKKKKNLLINNKNNNNNNDKENDPTKTIETKIKNIKISQKNDFKLLKNQHQNIDKIEQQKQQQLNNKNNNNNEIKKNIDFINFYEPPKNIPNDIIDYDLTQLDKLDSEPIYAFEIFEYLREKEQSTRCEKYMQKQPEISFKMRSLLVDWLVDVQQTFELNHETLYLTIKIMDHYLMNKKIERSRLQLLGIVSMFIAAKCEERFYPMIDDLLFVSDDAYNHNDVIKMEIDILQVLDFNLNYPLSYSFLRRFARCSSQTFETLTLSRYILESSLMDYQFIDELDSKMAAASLLLALKMKNLKWTKTLDFYTGYKENALIELVKKLNKLLKANTNTDNKNVSIRNKYSDNVFFGVANIKPLDDDDI